MEFLMTDKFQGKAGFDYYYYYYYYYYCYYYYYTSICIIEIFSLRSFMFPALYLPLQAYAITGSCSYSSSYRTKRFWQVEILYNDFLIHHLTYS